METYLVAHIATNKSKLQIILTYNAGQLRPMWRAKQFSSHITSSLCVSVLCPDTLGQIPVYLISNQYVAQIAVITCHYSTLTVHWHFIYLGGVVLLNISQDSNIIRLDKVDGHTLSAETT